jgi:hypothetical protein
MLRRAHEAPAQRQKNPRRHLGSKLGTCPTCRRGNALAKIPNERKINSMHRRWRALLAKAAVVVGTDPLSWRNSVKVDGTSRPMPHRAAEASCRPTQGHHTNGHHHHTTAMPATRVWVLKMLAEGFAPTSGSDLGESIWFYPIRPGTPHST